MAWTLAEVAEYVGGTVEGDAGAVVDSVGTLERAGDGQVSFFNNRRYRRSLRQTAAAAILLTKDNLADCPTNAIVVADPYLAYARVAGLMAETPSEKPGIDPSAVVSADATVAEDAHVGANSTVGPGAVIEAGVVLGPGCVVEGQCRIGEGSRLTANVTLYRGTTLGKRCLVHAGAVIGSDGFGFANDQGRWTKVPQTGGVRIGDDVEVGANTTIDRGAIEDTVIEDGVKLDNLIQVAHNVHIGAHTAMAGCVGIAGSTTIGRHCAVGGGAGILGHLEIADGVTVTAMSLVTKSIKEPGIYSSGTPLQDNERWHKNYVRFKQLDEMARRLKRLEKDLEQLKKG